MPGRKIPLVNEKIYHIFNRGVALQPTFLDKRDYDRAKQTFLFYQNKDLPIKYSHFLDLSLLRRERIFDELRKKKEFLCDIIAYALMPNHFHFILRQKNTDGISKFISNFINSYTRYFNTKKERIGTLFQGRFQAILVENDEQLIHLSRYVHLNPLTSSLLRSFKELKKYHFSSFNEYLGLEKSNYFAKKIVLSNFESKSKYEKFVLDSADYQKSLDLIKHLSIDN